ncbi:hypothetical protein DACRYDRAFT_19955 [Dacryopinax primogenitus]|uniref:Uncharacterized protein n=1 Tax=Dacryopinax primogenitus (strain DJM 731) TaxID=1858805 RepID=M5G9L4_DACPD|nr:uncharacterized protein DACRYDRAFT_19955 [Dacryopinax primogenitus]EJU05489.1 hypothetical protein DACRYDRAFT_19955 [Dacryopinax primogenitus]
MYNNRMVTSFLLVLYFICTLAPLLIVGFTLQNATLSPPFYWSSWIPPVVMETTLFLFTAARTFRSAVLEKGDAPLAVLLLRDGLFYYAAKRERVVCSARRLPFISYVLPALLEPTKSDARSQRREGNQYKKAFFGHGAVTP